MAGPLNLEQLITFLLETPMFRDLDEMELSQIVNIMQVQHLRDGQVLFQEGTPGDAWYVVYLGHVEVTKQVDGEEQVLARMGPQTCFGEMAVLDGSPRSATVLAAEDSTVLRFPRDAFDELIEKDTLAAYKLIYQMARLLAARQRRTTARLFEMLDDHDDERVAEDVQPIVEDATPAE